MSKNNTYTLCDIKHAVSVLEAHQTKKDYQALDEILPLVLVVLKSKVEELNPPTGAMKFYAPIWVDQLLERLSTQAPPLLEEEYQVFRNLVAELSVSDYKTAEYNVLGYKPVYTTMSELSQVVLALKYYFKLL